MSALKRKTVETEVLDELVGKKCKVVDSDGEYICEVTAVNADGLLTLESDKVNFEDVSPDDVEWVDDDENEEEVSDEEEETTEDEEDDVDEEIEESKEVSKLDESKYPMDSIKAEKSLFDMERDELKAFIKEKGIKVPLGLYVVSKFADLQKFVAEKVGVTSTEKPVEKVSEKKSVKKGSIKDRIVRNPVPKKEEVKKEVPQKKEKSISKRAYLAQLFSKGGGSKEELSKKIIEKFPQSSQSITEFTITDYGGFLVHMGILEHKDKGYYLIKK